MKTVLQNLQTLLNDKKLLNWTEDSEWDLINTTLHRQRVSFSGEAIRLGSNKCLSSIVVEFNKITQY